MIGSLIALGTRRTPLTAARIAPVLAGRSVAWTAAGAETGVDTRGLADAPLTAGSNREGRVWRAGGVGALFALPFLEPFLEEAPLLAALFFVEEAMLKNRVGVGVGGRD